MEVYTTKQAASYLSLSPHTLIIWRKQKRGPDYVKLGRAVRYEQKSLDEFLERNLTKTEGSE